MKVVRIAVLLAVAISAVGIASYFLSVTGRAQDVSPFLKPDIARALKSKLRRGPGLRKGSYQPARPVLQRGLRPRGKNELAKRRVAKAVHDQQIAPTGLISAGTQLSRVLHTSQIDMTSSAGTNEQFVDRTGDLVADDRTTFDNAGGSFDIAVGKSGSRYEVYSATLNNVLVGVLVVAVDTNGDFVADSSQTFDLERDFDLPSAAAVVSGIAKDGREFVIVSSSGYFNSDDPNDPSNEPSPGVVLLIRNPSTGGFDTTQSRTIVTVGDDRLFNANALALMPNNDLLIADFASNELRIIRDTNADGMPDTLDSAPYYSYQFSDDAPIDIAVNSRGVVFSHSEGDDTLLLAIYDDDHDGDADHDEVAVEGLSIDNNLFLHGLTTDKNGTVYLIEDASSSFDGQGGNGGTARIDAFADPLQNGFLEDGKEFTVADSNTFGLTGLGFGPVNNQLQDSTVFVRQHYRDFLNREPDAAGLQFWVDNIESCGSNMPCREVKRVDTSAAFFLSIEYQESGFLVYRLYKASLPATSARPRGLPRFNELVTDTQTVGNGVIVGQPNWQTKLNANTVAYINSFVGRAEFQAQYPANLTAAQYVDNLNTIANGALSQSERNNLVTGLTNGQETRATVLRKVADDQDFRNAEFNRAFVLMQYHGYLRRNPDSAPDTDFGGYDFWLNKLNLFGGDFRAAEMVKAFITSIEYKSRFD